MATSTTKELRTPHPDQSRIDQWSAETLRRSAGVLRVRETGFLNPRRGLVHALRDSARTPLEEERLDSSDR